MVKERARTYRLIVNIFIALTLFMMAAILHLTLSTATITLPQKTDNFVFDAPLTLSKQAGDGSLYGEIQSVEITDNATQPVAQKTTDSDTAGVSVTVINKSAKAQPLVKTTRFLSADGHLFRLQSAVNVPAGGQAKGYLVADQKGDDYLIPAQKFTIPGLWAGLQDTIYGQSTETASFKQLSAQALTDGDIKEASDNLMEAMKAKAIAQLQAKLPDNVKLNADQVVGHITNQDVDAKVGDTVDSFTITITATFDAMVFDPEALLTLTKTKLKEQLPDNVSVVTSNDSSFSYALTAISTSTETAEVKVHLEANVTTGAFIKDFINPKTLRGMTAAEAEQYLANQGLPGAHVTLSPFWVTRVPSLEDHIIIKSNNQ
jgi:hypothetical protein